MNPHPSVNSPSPDRVSVRAPATPLPWRRTTMNDGAIVLTSQTVRFVAEFGSTKGTEPDATRIDAAYAAHACNAYPKLVAALQDLRRNEALDDDDARLVSTRGVVDALLRELGELA